MEISAVLSTSTWIRIQLIRMFHHVPAHLRQNLKVQKLRVFPKSQKFHCFISGLTPGQPTNQPTNQPLRRGYYSPPETPDPRLAFLWFWTWRIEKPPETQLAEFAGFQPEFVVGAWKTLGNADLFTGSWWSGQIRCLASEFPRTCALLLSYGPSFRSFLLHGEEFLRKFIAPSFSIGVLRFHLLSLLIFCATKKIPRIVLPKGVI